MKILVAFAVRGELDDIHFGGNGGNEIVYCKTGIGKDRAAYALTNAILQYCPDLVVNMGTAGTLNHKVGEIFVCRRFVDRDMQKINALGVECEIDSSALLEERVLCLDWGRDGVCNTGNSFLTEGVNVTGDVVDMEAYAEAIVCREKKIPFVSVKYVTDIIGQNSVKHWEDKLADAREALGKFIEDNML